jgi:2-hydroxycyclohexanecarboxyl-CoA dehydrogenase
VRRFDERVAVVTGAASGIGRATALAFAAEGASILAGDVNREGVLRLEEEIRTAGGTCTAVCVDVTSTESVHQMTERAISAFGRIDILVSNAGWDQTSPFVDTSEELWDRLIAINYRGHLACTHAIVPHMIEKGSGRVITVASDAGRVGSSGEAVYSGTKGAVIAFSKALAREVARHGITVNCVAPGLVDTPLLTHVGEGYEKLIGAIVRSIPLGRIGKPEEIAHAILFLGSNDADYITGQTLSVNGGLNMP